MTSTPFLSIIIPAHNEEHRLPGSLDQIRAYLDSRTYAAEVLVVENGSLDGTFEVAQSYAARDARIRALQLAARGKGLAVKHGMLAARGAYRFMCDADLSMPIEEINRFLPPALEDFDIAIGSREAPGAVRYNEPAYRHLLGRIYNNLIRLMALPGLHDTQCGFKCFRAEVAEEIFPYQTLTGMSFDVEVLFVAHQRGYRIVEIPIPWYHKTDSRVRLLEDSLRMGMDLLTIQWNARQGKYENETGP